MCSPADAVGLRGSLQDGLRPGEERSGSEEGEEHLGGRLWYEARPHSRPVPRDLQDTGRKQILTFYKVLDWWGRRG